MGRSQIANGSWLNRVCLSPTHWFSRERGPDHAISRHKVGQVLLTHRDISHRASYLNASTTLRTLLGNKVVPVINENDAVSHEEIRFGDNDLLAALVAVMVEADLLLLLTLPDGLYDDD